MSGTLVLNLLGSPEVLQDGQPVTGFNSQKSQAVLFYLAVTRHTESRQKLAALMWPEEPDARGRRNLRNVALNLRQLLSDFVTITRTTMALDDNVIVDTDLLETAVTATSPDFKQLNEAVALYRGDFLEGFAVKQAVGFDDWVFLQNERYVDLQLQGLRWLADHALNQRDIPLGLQVTRQILQIDPWKEFVYRQRMLLFLYDQQPEAAMQAYEQCQRMLSEAFDTPPHPETQALYERIRSETEGEQIEKPLHNLPRQLTPFIGREEEASFLRGKVLDEAYPFITIMGEGGVGKTRLALMVASQTLYDFPDGVWFIPLMGIAETLDAHEAETALAIAISQALQIPIQTGASVTEQVVAYVKERKLLLLLDNMERLVDGVDFILCILKEAQHAQVVITSRRRLDLQAECVYRLQGLPLPEAEQETKEADSIAYAQKHTSVQLFMERALRTRSDFALTSQNVFAVNRICRLVGGLPLGIELAAALVERQSCVEMVAQIEADLGTLSVRLRDLPEHHRSVWSLFDYSWQLLSEAEQQLLAQCSVFAGGFTLAAATAVTNATAHDLDLFVNQSLLQQSAPDRYEFHPLVQQFCHEKFNTLAENNSHLKTTPARHTAYFLDWLRTHVASLGQSPVELLQTELNNIRQAWHTAIKTAQFSDLHTCIDAYYGYVSSLNLFDEGKDMFTEALVALDKAMQLQTTQELREIKGHLLFARYHLDSRIGRYDERMQTLNEVLTLIENPVLIGRVNITRTYVLIFQGNLEQAKGVAHDTEALLADQPKWHAQIFNHLAWIYATEGDAVQAQSYYEKAIATVREVGNLFMEQAYLHNFAQFWQQQRHYEQALSYYQQSLVLTETLHLSSARIETLISLSNTYNHLGCHDDALHVLEEAQYLAEQTKDLRVEMSVWHDLSLAYYSKGDVTAALQTSQRAVNAYEQLDATYELMKTYMLLGDIREARSELIEAEEAYRHALQLRQAHGDPASSAEPWAGLAVVALQGGDEAQAAAWVERILALDEEKLFYHKLIELPMMIYLRCYQVLTAVADPRADHIQKTAQAQLRRQANLITDANMRRCFLDKPIHQQILQTGVFVK